MKLTNIAFLIAGAASLAACTGMNPVGSLTGSQADLKALSAAEPQGSAFDKALAGEYLSLANYEAVEMFDHYDQQIFAKKGLLAAAGNSPALEESKYWNLEPSQVTEVDSMRERLTGLLANGSKQREPKWAAIAQAKFDCWVEQLEENFQPDHITACRQDLDEAIPYLLPKEVAAKPAPKPEPKPKPVAKPAAKPALPDAFIIFFDFDSSALTSVSKAVSAAIADAHKAHPKAQITLEGHTDSSGSVAYNQALSERRVEAVRGELRNLGVAGNSITGKASGEGDLAVATDDNVKEPRNRRVVVTFDE